MSCRLVAPLGVNFALSGVISCGVLVVGDMPAEGDTFFARGCNSWDDGCIYQEAHNHITACLDRLRKHLKPSGIAALQYAALPLQERDGETFVLLVTSRETRRWVVPKGWGERGLSGAQVAAKEAFEEAGVQGIATDTPIGCYGYTKRLRKGRTVECRVEVYVLPVDMVLPSWPEQFQRCREWFTIAQAALVIDDGELVPLLLRLAARIRVIFTPAGLGSIRALIDYLLT